MRLKKGAGDARGRRPHRPLELLLARDMRREQPGT